MVDQPCVPSPLVPAPSPSPLAHDEGTAPDSYPSPRDSAPCSRHARSHGGTTSSHEQSLSRGAPRWRAMRCGESRGSPWPLVPPRPSFSSLASRHPPSPSPHRPSPLSSRRLDPHDSPGRPRRSRPRRSASLPHPSSSPSDPSQPRDIPARALSALHPRFTTPRRPTRTRRTVSLAPADSRRSRTCTSSTSCRRTCARRTTSSCASSACRATRTPTWPTRRTRSTSSCATSPSARATSWCVPPLPLSSRLVSARPPD